MLATTVLVLVSSAAMADYKGPQAPLQRDIAAVLAEGVTDPLPYLPLLNPVDLSVALALAALCANNCWRKAARWCPWTFKHRLGKAQSCMPCGSICWIDKPRRRRCKRRCRR